MNNVLLTLEHSEPVYGDVSIVKSKFEWSTIKGVINRVTHWMFSQNKLKLKYSWMRCLICQANTSVVNLHLVRCLSHFHMFLNHKIHTHGLIWGSRVYKLQQWKRELKLNTNQLERFWIFWWKNSLEMKMSFAKF